MYDYLIVGAGLFGAVFAREMTDKGKKCLVIDKRPHVGGNIYTEKVEGIDTHVYGAHIFHTDDEKIWDYVNRFAEFNDFINSPVANYKGEIYNLPFNMNTFYQMWGVSTPDEAQRIIREQIDAAGITAEPKNLEEQALSLVGHDIYEKLIKGYTEKQWGKKCTELPAFIIRRVPLRFTYDNNYFNDRYQGIPEDGYTTFVEALLDGTDIRLGCNFFDCKEELSASAEKVLFTGMIDEYYGYSLGELEYRSLRFETEVIDSADYQGNAVVNYTDYSVPYTRIIEHKHFEKTVCDKTVITHEYPMKWKHGDEPYYPLNDDKNNELYERYKALAENEEKVIFGGRLGMYKYLDMDDVVKEAIKLAEMQK